MHFKRSGVAEYFFGLVSLLNFFSPSENNKSEGKKKVCNSNLRMNKKVEERSSLVSSHKSWS